MNITVRTANFGDDLSEVIWGFYVTDSWCGRQGAISLVLDSYTENQRATVRHKFKPVKSWHRLRGRMGRSVSYEAIEQPPAVPDSVRRRAIQKVTDSIDLVIDVAITKL